MQKLSKALLTLLFLVQLTACATVSINAEKAPGFNLSKAELLYLERSINAPIAHQKYLAAVEGVLREEGFNIAPSRKQAKYVMSIGFNDFAAPIAYSSPDIKTTLVNGRVGTAPVSGTATTIGNKQTYGTVPTHNSTISVKDRASGRPVWQASMAKSYEVYKHDELKKMIAGMLALYGKDGRATKIVGDDLRL